jgi:hypothetical protein
MTDLVTRLIELREKATPGPWTYDGCSLTNWHDHTFEMEWIVNGHELHDGTPINENKDADGKLICELVNNLDTIIAALQPSGEMGWQPIETAPKDGTNVLVGHERAVFSGWWSESAGGWVDGSTDMYEDLIVYHPTHWQPLPPLPSSKREG